MRRPAALFCAILLLLTTASCGQQSSSSSSDSSMIDPTAEKYYDYVQNNNQISLLFSHQEQKEGFEDSEMAAYAIGTFISMGKYDYQVGNSKEEFDAVTQQCFGAKLKDYNTSMSEVIPETGKVTGTGWDMGHLYLVLKDLKKNEDGSKTAVFYSLMPDPAAELPDAQKIKQELLSGNFEDFGRVGLRELRFEEKQDEKGQWYLKYRSANELGEAAQPYNVYKIK